MTQQWKVQEFQSPYHDEPDWYVVPIEYTGTPNALTHMAVVVYSESNTLRISGAGSMSPEQVAVLRVAMCLAAEYLAEQQFLRWPFPHDVYASALGWAADYRPMRATTATVNGTAFDLRRMYRMSNDYGEAVAWVYRHEETGRELNVWSE